MENTSFKVYIEEKAQDYGRLYLEPLERGYGDTLGNALRRLLLSSIRGAAVVAVRIDGILHEFSTIPGVREDVIEILMNLKHIPIKVKTNPDNDSLNVETFKVITLDSDELQKDRDLFNRAENPGVITAKDLSWDSDFEFCGDGVLCTLEPGAHLVMEIYIAQGVGYLSAERERPAQPQLPVDALLTDAIFSPVKRVNYQIEPARVGQSIDYERLILEVWTNGAISPEEAVGQASRIAQTYFARVADTVNTAPHVAPVKPPLVEEPVVVLSRPDPDLFLTHNIHDLELSIRSENCLLRGGIKLVSDLLSRSHDDLLKVRNLGKKSLDEIEDKLRELGYSLAPNSASAFTQPEPETEEEPKPVKSKTKKDAKPKKSSSKSKAKVEAPKAEEVKAEEAAPVEAVVTAPVEEPAPAVEPEVKEEPKPAKSKTKDAKPKKSSSKSKAKAEAPKAEEVKAEEAAPVEAVVTAPVEEPAPAVEPEVEE
ncbi:MAG: DNA-directed RNA polymerase subunit alpha, partial [Synergistales bacterium]|nr:DNA-directed RNA polymerase subunit alpha [Synergistales bacterium]